MITFIQDEEKDNMTECEEAGLLEGLWQLLTGSQEGEISESSLHTGERQCSQCSGMKAL